MEIELVLLRDDGRFVFYFYVFRLTYLDFH
jgi:hypothetical protein